MSHDKVCTSTAFLLWFLLAEKVTACFLQSPADLPGEWLAFALWLPWIITSRVSSKQPEWVKGYCQVGLFRFWTGHGQLKGHDLNKGDDGLGLPLSPLILAVTASADHGCVIKIFTTDIRALKYRPRKSKLSYPETDTLALPWCLFQNGCCSVFECTCMQSVWKET